MKFYKYVKLVEGFEFLPITNSEVLRAAADLVDRDIDGLEGQCAEYLREDADRGEQSKGTALEMLPASLHVAISTVVRARIKVDNGDEGSLEGLYRATGLLLSAMSDAYGLLWHLASVPALTGAEGEPPKPLGFSGNN